MVVPLKGLDDDSHISALTDAALREANKNTAYLAVAVSFLCAEGARKNTQSIDT
jgi:hypothetical protein